MSKILIGTSGWSYDDWVGPLYTSKEHMFSQYASIFPTVEVDSTFYRYPTPALIKGFIRASPRGFIFSLKMPKLITHTKKFNPKLGVKQDIERFLKLIKPLKDANKLGAILIQLPPVSFYEAPYFEEFIDLLPSDEYNFSVEFRHESWLKERIIKLLREYHIAYCIVDEPLLPPVTYVTANFAYIRWHGRGREPWYYYLYSIKELEEWVPRVKEVANKVELVLGYFNNHFRGFAPRNALQMMKLLNIMNTFSQELAYRRIEEYFKRRAKEELQRRALKALVTNNVEEILKCFTDKSRYQRGRTIQDRLVLIECITNSKITGKVKDYVVEIDLTNRTLYHDCEDWKKNIETAKFCKHLIKFFLKLPKQVSLKILNDIVKNLDKWKFLAKEEG